MFDFAWSEIALIGVVALIAIGPKDLPVAMKAITDMIKKARRMASEFQTHVDDMVKDANLGEVRDQINELRTMDIKSKILDAVDGDQTMRKALNEDPFAASSTATTFGTSTEAPAPALVGADSAVNAVLGDPASAHKAAGAAGLAEIQPPAAPAFIPPSEVPVQLPPAPAFIPPTPPAAGNCDAAQPGVDRRGTAPPAGHANPDASGVTTLQGIERRGAP